MKPKPAFLRLLSLTIFLLAASLRLPASPALPGLLHLTQPDGSVVDAYLSGDEHGHLMLTPDGCTLIQDADGWWCYARYDYYGNRINTGEHAADPETPGEVIAASRNIPWELLQRRRMSRLGGMNALHAAQALRTRSEGTSAGERHGLILLVQFQDLSFQHTRADFEQMICGSGPGTALTYFNDQWKGSYTFRFDISEIFTLPQDHVYYGTNDDSGNDKNAVQMVVDACEAAAESVDFSQYDNNGDGIADNVFIFFAGPNASDGAGDNYIWPHMWYLQSGAGVTYRQDGVLIDSYACTSELMVDDNRQTYTTFASIGTFCHEYTHTFGIPDLYDTDDNGSGGYSEAAWRCIDLMDAGNYNNRGRTPPNYSAVERWYFKMNEGTLLTEGRHTLRPVQENGDFYILPTDTEEEYYLLECREQKGWDAYIGGSGLLIYHIDRSQNPAGQTTGDDGTGKVDVTAGRRWELNQVNAWPDHQCIDIIEPAVQARKHFQDAIQSRNYDAIFTLASQAFWPYYDSVFGEVNVFTGDTEPAFRFWSGTASTLGLDAIRREADGSISFTVFNAEDMKVPAVRVDKQIVFQDASIVQWSCTDPDFSGKGVIRYGDANSTQLKEVEVSPYEDGKYAYVMEGLSPNTAYKVQLLCKRGNIPGPINVNAAFTTHSTPKAGSFPYIYLKNVDRSSDGSFSAGAPLCLRVYNAVDTDVRWYFNGLPVYPGADGYYHLQRSGQLKAVVDYADGSTDIITKDIVVK